jgi:hypothetical protein
MGDSPEDADQYVEGPCTVRVPESVAEPVHGRCNVCAHFEHARVCVEAGTENGVLLSQNKGSRLGSTVHGGASELFNLLCVNFISSH